ncbi:GNAT family N-acetyltransferase [Microbacterium sp. GXF0217]
MTVRLEPLPADRFDSWREAVRARLVRRLRGSGLRPGTDADDHADAIIAQMFPQGVGISASAVLGILIDDVEAGTVWLSLPGERAFLIDVYVDRELDRDERDDVVTLVQALARDTGAVTLSADVHRGDDETRNLLDGRGFEVSSIQMLLDPLPERDGADERDSADERVEVAPMSRERFERFAADAERGFAEELAATGRISADDALAEAQRQFRVELPDGVDTDGQELFTAAVDGEEVGVLWLSRRMRAGAPHGFILDIAVHPPHQRRGYGRALMHAAERETRRMGAASLGLHVFGGNTPAVALYEQLGYRRIQELVVATL